MITKKQTSKTTSFPGNLTSFRLPAVGLRLRGFLPRQIPIAVKLSLAVSLLVTLGMVLLGSVVINNQEKLLRKQINAHGNTVAIQLAESAKELILADDRLSLGVLTRNMINDKSILGTGVFDDKGNALASAGITPLENGNELVNVASPVNGTTHSMEWQYEIDGQVQDNLVSFLHPVTFQDVRAGYVLITFSRASLDTAVHDSVRAITAATILMIILAIIISYAMSRKVSQPINYLMDASKAIDEGRLTYRISERRNDEIGNLINAFNSMADGLLKKSQVEDAFSRFVSTNVAKQIMNDLDNVEIGGEHVHGSVLFADIVGYTDISENLPSEEIAKLLNEYFSYIGEATKLYYGNIDKFMGDCAMVVFGIPQNDPDHAFHAIGCAVLIQRLVERLNTIRIEKGQFPVQFRLGINSGDMLAGNMGYNDRMEFTVVGDSVNLASRLCTFAAPGEIVINKDTYATAGISQQIVARQHKPIQLRSRKHPVATYVVTGLAAEHELLMEKQIEQILAGKAAA
ncbi:adenylate/guanylate cyclase domain-containing protein [Sulfuriflexus sp.]|uniref:adenylate/guanylate cyclase domain-containing protein n=1 Tax=Sulfuriflexus sp. TaxID=2015443 RepID=UPI0028CDD315|nr:adenylate/guanylate cyclase domain-containing protein [Sulfuriflexus sp.]MDT8403263.1 adenylate/guanylate cyclase domain-containing protein [Sulfuriflexus sp.]